MASHRGGGPSRYKRPRLDDQERPRPSSPRHRMRSRGADDDDEDLNLLPSESAFNDAAAARAADPLGLNEALWEQGWEGGKLYSSATPVDATTVDEPAASPHPSDGEGASDFSDEDERAAYVSVRRTSRIERQGQERKKELEERRLARIKALEEAGEAGASGSNGVPPSRVPASLSKATFQLMVKTAAAVRAATKPKQLELRILTHHGGDERFAFLRRESGRANEVWERLKAGETLKWEDVDETEEAKTRHKGATAGLLSGYDSESESEQEEQESSAAAAGGANEAGKKNDQAASPSEVTPVKESMTSTEDIDTGQKAKDRIARARQWAAQQRAAKEATQPAVSEA